MRTNKPMVSLSRGMLTIGSVYSGLGFQVYWPEINLEWARNKTTRNKIAPCGFCVQFGNTLRIVADPVEQFYVAAFKVLGCGLGFQYLKPETRTP